MSKLTNILAVLVALAAVYAGNKVLNDTALAMTPKAEATLKTDLNDNDEGQYVVDGQLCTVKGESETCEVLK